MDETDESKVDDLQAKSIPPVMANYSVPPQMQQYPRGQQAVAPNEDPMRFLIPVHPSIWAVVAGYVGLFSVLMVPAPFAFILGIVALRDIKKNPTKTGRGRAIFGIIIGTVFTIFFAVVILNALRDNKPQ